MGLASRLPTAVTSQTHSWGDLASARKNFTAFVALHLNCVACNAQAVAHVLPTAEDALKTVSDALDAAAAASEPIVVFCSTGQVELGPNPGR